MWAAEGKQFLDLPMRKKTMVDNNNKIIIKSSMKMHLITCQNQIMLFIFSQFDSISN